MPMISEHLERLFLRFFPNLCPLCGREMRIKDFVCCDCQSELNGGPLPVRYETKLFTAYFYGRYDSKLRDLILVYKNGKHWRLSFVIASCLQKLFLRYPTNGQLITWVPSSYRATEERGFETMRLVAKRLSKLLDIPAKQLLVSHAKSSRRNVAIGDRSKVISGSIYSVQKINGDIILVDDVFTTGATVAECVRVLKESGARRIAVYCLAIAKEVS